jgi:hypothetical protein
MQLCEATARRLQAAYHLKGFAIGVDGTVVKFEEASRDIPEGNDARIWATSPGKEVINRQRWFLVVGDSAYQSVKLASRCTVLLRPLLTHQSAFTT